ncbi:hypothetical protein J8L85_15330 [Maribacter sp. MMG018]|nr:hypothetical protein [Maribacter sp. MMG018]
MKYAKILGKQERNIVTSKFAGFIPDEIFDIHAYHHNPKAFCFRCIAFF